MYVYHVRNRHNIFSCNKQHFFSAKSEENSNSYTSKFDINTNKIVSKDRNEDEPSPKRKEDL